MKRSAFLSSVAALSVTPCFSARAILTPSLAVASGASVAPPNLYSWRAMLVRRQVSARGGILEALNVDVSQASTLLDRLVANNVVGPAKEMGVATAKPITVVTKPPVRELAKVTDAPEATPAQVPNKRLN